MVWCPWLRCRRFRSFSRCAPCSVIALDIFFKPVRHLKGGESGSWKPVRQSLLSVRYLAVYTGITALLAITNHLALFPVQHTHTHRHTDTNSKIPEMTVNAENCFTCEIYRALLTHFVCGVKWLTVATSLPIWMQDHFDGCSIALQIHTGPGPLTISLSASFGESLPSIRLGVDQVVTEPTVAVASGLRLLQLCPQWISKDTDLFVAEPHASDLSTRQQQQNTHARTHTRVRTHARTHTHVRTHTHTHTNRYTTKAKKSAHIRIC